MVYKTGLSDDCWVMVSLCPLVHYCPATRDWPLTTGMSRSIGCCGLEGPSGLLRLGISGLPTSGMSDMGESPGIWDNENLLNSLQCVSMCASRMDLRLYDLWQISHVNGRACVCWNRCCLRLLWHLNLILQYSQA